MKTERYPQSLNRLPQQGRYLIGYQTEHDIVVYQAYRPQIADYAVAHQKLGGAHFSYDRMSWIKPGFLWMMYRCGWATKTGQERVLAITLSKEHFRMIVDQAVPTTFKPKQYEGQEAWKAALRNSEVRVQWDPDHSPYGGKLERKAIQLGLKGSVLEAFGRQYITRIDDVTEFVKEQRQFVDRRQTELLNIPFETVMEYEGNND